MKRTICRYGVTVLLCCVFLLLTACSRSYTVTFDLNGGTLLSGELVQTVKEGGTAIAPKAEMKNHTLSWDRNFSIIKEDITVTAKWIPNQYTVSFDLNGGELISGATEQTVKAGTAAVAPEAVNGDLQLSWDTDFSNITGDTVVTAQWEKVKMDENMEEMTQYVQERTVSIHVKTVSGSETVGAGFFIDESGTIATTWKTIKGAEEITIIVNSGDKFSAAKIVGFDQLLDLAILKIDVRDSKYLKRSDETVQDDETIYMADFTMKSLTSKSVRVADFMVGDEAYLETDTAFSSENRGAPLVNAYGEVVGINGHVYKDYGLVIKIGTLERLKHDKNWAVQKFGSWYKDELSRSYSPWDGENYYESTVNTYQAVTNRECDCSYVGDELMDGYSDRCEGYVYMYYADELEQYEEYLEKNGFLCEERKAEDGAVITSYYNACDDILIRMEVESDSAHPDVLWISVWYVLW